MREVITSHAGKQHSYKHALSLQKANLLKAFYTSTYYKRDKHPDKIFKRIPKADEYLSRRWQEGLQSDSVVRNLLLEMPEIVFRNALRSSQLEKNAVCRRDMRFDAWIAKKNIPKCDVFWGFQGSCLKSLAMAKENGAITVLELATAHVTAANEILREEARKHPEWADTISNYEYPEWYESALKEEPHIADYCVVASQFSKDSLIKAGVGHEKIKLLPLAADLRTFQFARRRTDGKLRVLFVGGIGQRKGIKYLLQAIKNLKSESIELQLMGPLPNNQGELKKWSKYYQYLGKGSQQDVVDAMHGADVLVLPSVFEGFGLVILEAMATGMPVIASTHTAGTEIIENAVSGYVVEPDDINQMSCLIEDLSINREKINSMGYEAHLRSKDYTWERHSQRVKKIIEDICVDL